MCHWKNTSKQLQRRLGGVPVETAFPARFVHAFPPGRAAPGHCLICGTPLSQKQMYPRGLTPRYMCESCYNRAAYEAPKSRCLLWGQQLPQHLQNERQRNPRELVNAFCEGTCRDYWTMLAGRVLGTDFNVTNALPPATEQELLALPCSSTPQPSVILPQFNANHERYHLVYAEYRFRIGRYTN